MNENRSKRREWVKTVAIIFLSIMLVLTFFSQTIMNRSLPEVATKYVQSGSITSKIRGSGVVESGDPYVIEIPGIYVGRKVSSIKVKVGDKVEKGDVLFTLADGDGAELEAAKEAVEAAKNMLNAAQDAYDSFILDANITSTDIHSANANVSTASLRQKLTDLQNALSEEKKKIEPIETAISQLTQAWNDCQTQISYENEMRGNAADKVATQTVIVDQAQEAQESAQSAFQSAADEVAALKAQKAQLEESLAQAGTQEEASEETQEETPQESQEDLQAQIAGIEAKLEAAEKKLAEKKSALDQANAKLDDANKGLAEAQKVLREKEASQTVNNLTKQQSDYKLSQYNYEKELKTVNDEISRLEREMNELVGTTGTIKRLQDLQDAIDTAKADLEKRKKKVEELEGELGEGVITADVSGTIMTINVTSGKQIQTQDVCILQPEGQGYFMTITVTNDQAKTVSVGDRASLINSWWYSDMDIVLQSIKPDKAEPAKKKMLTFAINGDVTAGQSLSVSVGQKSQNYDYIVPNSAIKEDNNGKFILTVESRNSPVGNRYIATRVDVQVLASDDTQSAISGAFDGWAYVITTSSKPINPGDQVRMTDN